jgi:hypothetical protein
MSAMTYEIIQADGRPDSIRCLRCKLVSHNPNDVAALYCGNCHKFHARDGVGERPPDRIELLGGMVHWPETLREVARAANAAGLAGHKVADVDCGIDMATLKASVKANPDALKHDWPARIEITYEDAS